jgi:hypothetical protein
LNTLDLGNPPPNHRYKVSVDPQETTGERAVRLTKDLVIFLLAATFVGSIFYLAFATVESPIATAEEKKWAMSILSAGAAGMVGYLVRK